ncbi:multidrug effflux MFS transporter [Aureimonas phyllosphaerae]|uniref:DHA1 family bicyclomycin/chloramphenicol resistance-like MFS transporter n=1 Tax=Aureimonas phyllosphaerae TaxID=1166078 RepID=A0A7W6BS55_9HYPH|nr:multidrug effflux MFS transporter [Aureimonas phyllosphaerae]MBB3937069.1 DHA1 family bicyclomycin/chloramphenicol resistance-like MFS transporter [Aureimonas phyllosphaerae]MBB3960816.1 DHA1 family bicyclomycin/chloramphenicol resistance-like MFS transporter [Aureimonas phyllosphaerae]SFF49986.1 MFS transporter, DHA1 family, bicyclomycin/chloramphenicol resistance protein [Aureimonas phyllosphaerae]
MSPIVPHERIVLYASLTALTAISIDALLPGLRDIAGELGAAPPLSTQQVVTLFIFGMVFGELLLGPISDAIGRKRALVAGLGVYAVGTLVALFASSLEGVILGRILQGIGVAGPKIATRAMIRDQFEGEAMARVMSFLFSLFILVPMVAPALGQGVIALAGWRGMFALYFMLALGLGAWLVLRQPETLPPERRISLRPRTLVRNGARILANRRVALLIVATGFVFGAQLLYLSIAADLFADVYGISETFPVYFALLAGGIGLASYLNGRLVGRFGMDAMARGGFLGLTLAGLMMLAASIGFDGRPPLALFLGSGFAAFFAIGVLFGNLNAMAMRALGELAGLGASLIASGSSLVATLFAMGLGALYDGTVLVLAGGIVLAGIASLLLSELSARGSDGTVAAIR